jgi:hypothetical protein
MGKENDINIKIELNRDKTQNLSIITYFNQNSSNFFKEGDYYVWKPTLKEKEFIIDAFKLIIDSNIGNNKKGKIFKFSDKDSNNDFDIENNRKSKNNIKEKNEKDLKINKNQENIINKTIRKNLSDHERDKRIEKILRDKKLNNF